MKLSDTAKIYTGASEVNKVYLGSEEVWSSGPSYQAETLAYQARVEADGGAVVSLADIDAAVVWAKAQGLYATLKCWVSAQFAYKNDIDGTVAKLYDLGPQSNDLVQTSLGGGPTRTDDQQNGYAGLVTGFTYYDRRLVGGTFAAPSAYTLVTALKDNREGSGTQYHEIFYNGTNSSNGFGTAVNINGNRAVLHGAIAWNQGSAATADPEIIINGYSAGLWQRVNGAAQTIGSSSYAAPSGGSLSLGGGNSFGWNGDIFEAAAYAASLTTEQAQAWEAYLNGYWAIY